MVGFMTIYEEIIKEFPYEIEYFYDARNFIKITENRIALIKHFKMIIYVYDYARFEIGECIVNDISYYALIEKLPGNLDFMKKADILIDVWNIRKETYRFRKEEDCFFAKLCIL